MEGNRRLITLECKTCKRAELHDDEEQAEEAPDKLELSKFCPRCRKHTEHKETARSTAAGRPVAPTVEQRSPKPRVGGSNPSWPASISRAGSLGERPEGSAAQAPAPVRTKATARPTRRESPAAMEPKRLVVIFYVIAAIALGARSSSGFGLLSSSAR